MIRARAASGLWNPYARRVIVRILLFRLIWSPVLQDPSDLRVYVRHMSST